MLRMTTWLQLQVVWRSQEMMVVLLLLVLLEMHMLQQLAALS
jgi:hypothetical protein